MGPKPGMLISRRAVSSFCASFAIVRSSRAIASSRFRNCTTSGASASHTSNGIVSSQASKVRSSPISSAIIRHAVCYIRFTLSYRDVEGLLAERGLDISYETIRRWVLTSGPLFLRELRCRRSRPTLARRQDGRDDRRQAVLALPTR
jgi:hypothetical protein